MLNTYEVIQRSLSGLGMDCTEWRIESGTTNAVLLHLPSSTMFRLVYSYHNRYIDIPLEIETKVSPFTRGVLFDKMIFEDET